MVSEVLPLWRAEPDTHGPIPTEAAFIIRPTHSTVQVITFSVALSSSEETGSPKRASGLGIQFGLAQTNQNSYKIFAVVTSVAVLQLFCNKERHKDLVDGISLLWLRVLLIFFILTLTHPVFCHSIFSSLIEMFLCFGGLMYCGG